MTRQNPRSNSKAIAHNPPALKQQRGRVKKLGFNLIEAAIVLAVVGGVIGTIWVSAATVYENYKVNKTVEQALMISQCIRNKFPRLQCDYSNICIGSAVVWWEKETDFVGKVGCIPNDIEMRGVNPTRYYDMFGKELFVFFGDAGDGSARMVISFGRWPDQSNTIGLCAKLANRIANLANTNDIWDIQTGINTNPNFLSLGINEWITACENSVSQSVSIKFNPS